MRYTLLEKVKDHDRKLVTVSYIHAVTVTHLGIAHNGCAKELKENKL